MDDNHYLLCRVVRAATHEWRSDAFVSELTGIDQSRVTELTMEAVRRKIMRRQGTTSCIAAGRDHVLGMCGLISDRLRIVGAARPTDLRASIHFNADTALTHGRKAGLFQRCKSRLETYYWLASAGDVDAAGEPQAPSGVEIRRAGVDRATLMLGDRWALDAVMDPLLEAWQVRKIAPSLTVPESRVPFLGVLAMQLGALNTVRAPEVSHV